MVLAPVLLMLVGLVGCGDQSPEAQFTAAPKTGYVPKEVQFTDISLGDIDSWEWDFDNDEVVDSTLQHPQHTYNTPGNYTISLTVSGSRGSDTETKIACLQFSPPPCQADFVAEPTKGDGVTEVQFSDQSTGEVTSWFWDLNGDGIVNSTEQNPVYTYRTNGLYSVILVIRTPYCEDHLTKRDYIQIIGCRT